MKKLLTLLVMAATSLCAAPGDVGALIRDLSNVSQTRWSVNPDNTRRSLMFYNPNYPGFPLQPRLDFADAENGDVYIDMTSGNKLVVRQSFLDQFIEDNAKDTGSYLGATLNGFSDTLTVKSYIDSEISGISLTPGPQGDPGVDGVDGDAATISVGTVTTGSAGSSVSITNVGTSSAATFNFTIPRGDKGDTGDTGVVSVSGTSPLTLSYNSGTKTITGTISAATTSAAGTLSSLDKTKLDGIASGATANQTDAYLLSRANHTGSQAISTITGLQTALDGKFAIPTGTTLQYVRGDGTLATLPSPGAGTVTSVGVSSTDLSVSGSPVTSSGSITVNLNTSGVSSGSYTKVTVNTKGIVTAGINPTQNDNVSRSLNSNYTISSTQRARVSYTVRVAYNVTALLSSTGNIILQYSTNGGTTWIDVNSAGGGKNLGVILSGYDDYNLSGEIPANALVRLNSTATNATNSYIKGQEVLE